MSCRTQLQRIFSEHTSIHTIYMSSQSSHNPPILCIHTFDHIPIRHKHKLFIHRHSKLPNRVSRRQLLSGARPNKLDTVPLPDRPSDGARVDVRPVLRVLDAHGLGLLGAVVPKVLPEEALPELREGPGPADVPDEVGAVGGAGHELVRVLGVPVERGDLVLVPREDLHGEPGAQVDDAEVVGEGAPRGDEVGVGGEGPPGDGDAVVEGLVEPLGEGVGVPDEEPVLVGRRVERPAVCGRPAH